MSNVWATMPYVQLSHNMLVNCIDNRQNQLFSEMSLRDVMELPMWGFIIGVGALFWGGLYYGAIILGWAFGGWGLYSGMSFILDSYSGWFYSGGEVFVCTPEKTLPEKRA